MTSVAEVPIIDLFAGAGGFSVAAKLSGQDVRLSVELDPTACETLRSNALGPNHSVLESDVQLVTGDALREMAGLRKSDPVIVVGGPPCQPFSKASYWTDPGHDSRYRRARARGEAVARPSPITKAKADERRDLLKEFFRLVIESRADAFVMENVRSLLHPRNRPTFNALLDAFTESGYHCTVVDAMATEYGVPQKRHRIFVLGSRATTPLAPGITHSDKIELGLPSTMAVGEFIAPFAGTEFFEPEEVVEGKWAQHLMEVPPGWNYKHHTEWAGHPSPTFEAESRFWNFLLKLSPDKPSWTINANPGPWTGPFHWESRRLRTPELAAIQTFPLGYTFKGSRRERVRQIGNAVPPKMASVMIKSVTHSLSMVAAT